MGTVAEAMVAIGAIMLAEAMAAGAITDAATAGVTDTGEATVDIDEATAATTAKAPAAS